MIKKCLLAVLVLMVIGRSYAQIDSAFTFRTELIHEFVRNFHGGMNTGGNFNGRIGVTMGFDTKKANLWKGGYVFAQVFGIYSGLPSSFQVLDIQPISRIEASNRINLFEFWYRQDIGPVQFIVGQHDMNSMFGVNQLAGTLINTSFGIYPSLTLETPLAIYPAATSAMIARVKVSPKLLVQAAAYDGKPLTFAQNPYNVRRDWNLLDQVFTTAEVTYSNPSENGISNVYKVGIMHHNGTYVSRLSGESERGRTGAYLNVQTYLLARDERKLGTFLQLGTINASSNLVDIYSSAGVHLKGIFRRKEDGISLGVVHSSINRTLVESGTGYAPHRTVVEMNYQLVLSRYFRIQPDIQYIINPGARLSVPNALVGILRVSTQF